MPEANIFAEKRAHRRVAVKIPVKYRVMDDQTEVKSVAEMRKRDHAAETLDASLGGLYIVSKETLVMGSMLRLDILLAGSRGKSLTAIAEVVWVNEAGGGLRFLTMKKEDADTLEEYLDKASRT